MNYWLIGSLTGMGKRKRAGHTDVWKEMRASAYFGLCDSERRLRNYDEAIGNCQKSLRYDPTDPYANYALGLAYAVKGSNPVNKELLAAARTQFQKMLDINADLSEASIAKTNIARIEAVLK